MTATATTAMRVRIASILKMDSYKTVDCPMDRPNIHYTILAKERSRGSHIQEEYIATIRPYLEELKEKGNKFPLTIAYAGLDWGGYLHRYSIKFFYDGHFSTAGHPLVAHFHAKLPTEVTPQLAHTHNSMYRLSTCVVRG